MTDKAPFEIFLVTAPGLESSLCSEAIDLGFEDATAVSGGVIVQGDWPEVWRANLVLRGAGRVLARVGSFRAMHLAQLDKRARKFPWAVFLRPDVPVRVEATCHASRIYHAGAAAQRIATAISEELGATVLSVTGGKAATASTGDDAEITDAVAIKVRISDDLCTISIDTSGASLHKRGHKEAVGKAPMRENLAALFLRQCAFTGHETVLDPMCGSGTFVLEAAEIASGMVPGRSRSFAFERLATFDQLAWESLKNIQTARTKPPEGLRFYGSDRDDGVVRKARMNAIRAGVDHWTSFRQASVSSIEPPAGLPGLVIVNPPYGTRIGERKLLFAAYGALGKTLMTRFSGWRVGLITSDGGLAKSTGLPFEPLQDTVSHGGLRIGLYRTGILPGQIEAGSGEFWKSQA